MVRYVQGFDKVWHSHAFLSLLQDQRKGRTERSSVERTREVMSKEPGTEKRAGKDVRYLRPDQNGRRYMACGTVTDDRQLGD